MYTTNNQKHGVVKTTWDNIEPLVANANPSIASMINKLSPDKKYPLYLVYLPYGMLKGDTESSFLPTMDNKYCKLSDPSLPQDMINDLGYGMHTSPLGMVLEKTIEYFIEHNNEVTPYNIVSPGHVFHKKILLNSTSKRNYSANGILKASAGARTAFSLPSISNFNSIVKLSSEYNENFKTPRNSSEHGIFFKKICSANNINSDWRTCLLYFSKKWIDSIRKDPTWSDIKYHILEEDRKEGEFEAKNIYYDLFYSYVENKHNLKITNPYLTKTIYHLFKVALGNFPSYAPANSENCLPLRDLQRCLYNNYGIEQHPTIMVPNNFIFEDKGEPIYYSLQMPSMPNFSIKRNKRISANKEIESLNLMLPEYLLEMKNEQGILKNTVFHDMSNNIDFSFYHNVPTNQSIVKHSSIVKDSDTRFLHNCTNIKTKNFCHEGQFLRGCIKISSI